MVLVRQSTLLLESISHTVFVMCAPAQFALGNLDAYSFCATPGFTVDTCSCSVWERLLDVFPAFSLRSGTRILRSFHILLSPGFAGRDAPCAVFPSFVGWQCRARRRLWQWYVRAGFAGHDSLRLSVGHAALVVDTGSGMCWLVLLVLMHVALCGLWGLSCLAAWRKCTHLMLRLRGLPELIALGIWTLFLQPLHADRHLAAVSGLHDKSLGWVSAQALAHVNLSQRLGCIASCHRVDILMVSSLSRVNNNNNNNKAVSTKSAHFLLCRLENDLRRSTS